MSQPIFPITMPRWGIEMTRGTITEWHVAPGQSVRKGESLLDVETDKIVNTVEAPVNGTLRAIVVESGTTEDAGALLAVLADLSVSDDAVKTFIKDFRPGEPSPVAAAVAPAAKPAAGEESKVSPIARRIAERLGVDITKVTASAANGRISKEDVEAYATAHPRSAAAAATPATSSTVEAASEQLPVREKMSATRATIAKRLLESTQGIPHYRLEIDVDFTALLEHRAGLNTAAEPVSVNDLIVRATALALVSHPTINAQLVGDEIVKFPHADIGIAVVTDKGLVTPVLRGADTKTARAIATETKELAQRARSGALTREEISGGSFTISNLGMFGVDRFDAIINPPQVAILAVAAAVERVVARDGKAVVRKIATLTLSADHRVVDGAAGAQFLGTLRQKIEAPASL